MFDGDAKIYVFLTIVFIQNAWLELNDFLLINY